MRVYVAGLILAAGLLASCGQAQKSEESAPQDAVGGYAVNAPAPAPPPMAQEQAADTESNAGGEIQASRAPPTQPTQPTPGGGGTPSPVLFLAYTYGMGLELPAANVAHVMDAHVQACVTAGPRLCQLIGSNKSGDPESSMNGFVQMRGEPNWLRTFMGGVSAQAEAANGRVTGQTVNSEDLTRQIVDTEARLRALRSLRDRLQRLLDSRPGRLSDLLEVERELARVQGELDATESGLAVMRTRVSMSELTINYASKPQSLASDTFLPLRNALAGFLGIIVGGFAVIITLIAGLIPFAVVIVPIVWGLIALRRRRGGRFFRRTTETAPEIQPPPATE